MDTKTSELVRVVIILTFGALLGWFTAPCRGQEVSETITVSPTPATSIGNQGYIDNSFMGFHYENQILQSTELRATNTNLIKIYNKLLGNKGTLRMGGSSSNSTSWGGICPAGNGTMSSVLCSGDIDAFVPFVKAVGWRVIFDVNDSATFLTQSEQEVPYVASALGSSLWGFEYGNEPTVNAAYEADWANFYSATSAYPHIGPAGLNYTYDLPFAQLFGSDVILLTSHYYINAANSSDTVFTMLASLDTGSAEQTTDVNNIIAAVTDATNYVGGTHLWRMSESNDYAGGGVQSTTNPSADIDDTFASALWVLEHLFEVASNGGEGVDITNDLASSTVPTYGYTSIYCGTGNPATDINLVVDNGPNCVQIRPEFYGELLWEKIANGTIQTATPSGAAGPGFHSYAISENDGSYGVVLANNGETAGVPNTNAVQTTINLPSAYAGASYMTLTAPSLNSTSPGVLDLYSFDPGPTLGASNTASGVVGVDGSWSYQLQMLPLTDGGKTATVTVNSGSAVWVNFTNNTVLTGSITSQSGPSNARLLNFSVANNGNSTAANNGTATVTSSQIDGFTLTQTSGTPCTPLINTSFPLSIGDIPAGGSATGGITIDFSDAGCPATALFTVNAWFSGNGGSTTGVSVLPLSVIVAPPVSLTTTSSVSGTSATGYSLSITVTNTGGSPATNVTLTSATLGSATGSLLPQTGGTIAAGGTHTFTVSVPGSAGLDGAGVAERVSGTYTGGTFSGNIRSVTLP